MKLQKNIFYAIVLVGLALYFAYIKGWIFANFESIPPKSAAALLQKERSVAILDVRTLEEYKSGHIPGALHMPVGEIEGSLSKLQNLQNKKIVVYCRSGVRSVKASRILSENGWIPINLSGGFAAWSEESLPQE